MPMSEMKRMYAVEERTGIGDYPCWREEFDTLDEAEGYYAWREPDSMHTLELSAYDFDGEESHNEVILKSKYN